MGTMVSVRFRGLPVRVHIATVFFFWFVIAGVSVQFEEDLTARIAVAIIAGSMTAMAIVGREVFRAFLFHRQGATVRGLDFFLAGSIPRLDDKQNSPSAECVAGLLSLIVTGTVTSFFWLLKSRVDETTTWFHILAIISFASLGILAIQILPALPFDGGRMLRAFIWHLSDDPVRASRGAAVYGHLIAAAMIGVGVVLLVRPGSWPYWGLALMVAGLQVVTVSAAAVRDSFYQQLGKVQDLQSMVIGWSRKVDSAESVTGGVAALIAEGDGPPLLVVDESGMPVGLFSREQLKRTSRRTWDSMLVSEVMKPLSIYPSVSQSTSIWNAYLLLESTGSDYLVLDDGERRVRFLSKKTLVNHLNDSGSVQKPT